MATIGKLPRKTRPVSDRRRVPWWRRQYIVNRELQTRYARSAAILGLVSSSLSAGLLLWSFWSFNIWQGQRLPPPVVLIILFCLLLNAGLIYVVAIISTQRIAGPLFNMMRQFQKIGNGEFEARAQFRNYDELHYVGRRFNDMVARLEQRERARKETVTAALARLEAGDVEESKKLLTQLSH